MLLPGIYLVPFELLRGPPAQLNNFCMSLLCHNAFAVCHKNTSKFMVINASRLVDVYLCGGVMFLDAGTTLSILDGILFAVKDDIDCLPHPSTGSLSVKMILVSISSSMRKKQTNYSQNLAES
jgi:hypothetical protein